MKKKYKIPLFSYETVYVVTKDLGQDCGIEIKAICQTELAAKAIIDGSAGPRSKYQFDIESFPLFTLLEKLSEKELRERIAKLRKEVEACLPKSCVKCKYRSIDGAPEPIPICSHPSLKIWGDMFIIYYGKNPPERPPKCPLRNGKPKK